MPGKGPAPTPTEILKLRGSRVPERRVGEVQYDRDAPTCPMWFKGEARAEWRRMAKQLQAANVLQKVDRGALVSHCEAWAEFVEACKMVEVMGRTYETQRGGLTMSPWVRIKNAAAERLLQLAQQFGFTPSARTRIRATSPPAADDTTVSGFARKRGAS